MMAVALTMFPGKVAAAVPPNSISNPATDLKPIVRDSREETRVVLQDAIGVSRIFHSQLDEGLDANESL